MCHILIRIYQCSCNKTIHVRKYLGLDYIWNFLTAYVPVEQTVWVSTFLVIYIYIFWTNLHYHTQEEKLESTWFHSGLPHFVLATWRWIFYAIPIPSLYLNLENTKKTNKTLLNQFPFSLELWMYHTPLTWYEQVLQASICVHKTHNSELFEFA